MKTSCSMISAVNYFLNKSVKTRPFSASFLLVPGNILGKGVVFALSLFLVACGSGRSEQVVQGATMGTTYHVKFIFSDSNANYGHSSAKALGAAIEQLLDKLDSSMSTYKHDSELERFNRSLPGENFSLSQELYEVLKLSHRVYEITEGAFDPSVGPLVNLWGFGPEIIVDEIPADADIQLLKARTGFDKIRLDEKSLSASKTSQVQLDLSAIAKGYAVDKIAELLKAKGIHDFLVEVGGELRLSGYNIQGEPWKIAVERPELIQGRVHSVLALTNRGLATSGDYRNYFELNGQRYSHTIDPRTGYPITHKLVSVTVVTPTAAEADGLATGFLVLGEEAALAIAEARNIPVFLLVKSTIKPGEFDVNETTQGASAFKAYYTEGFKPYLVDLDD